MISTLFSDPLSFASFVIALLIALTVHEFSHALVAEHLGDPTPRLQGRLSLNPLVHLDKFGTLFMLFFGFGWGKPVQFDPYNLKNPRKDAALISIAGPISNLLIALLCSLIIRLFILLKLSFLVIIGLKLLLPILTLNVMLGIFNLIPINPLDGFKIVGGLLSEEKSREWYQLEKLGIFFLLALFIPIGNGSMIDFILKPAINFVMRLLLPASVGGII